MMVANTIITLCMIGTIISSVITIIESKKAIRYSEQAIDSLNKIEQIRGYSND